MNANELIDELEIAQGNNNAEELIPEAIAMLRILDGQLAFRIDAVTKYQAKVDEQQAEIEALKAENSHLKYEISSGAWNPVKELTDKEIEKIAEEFKDVDYTLDDEEAFDVFNHRGFARAILRKAQEK